MFESGGHVHVADLALAAVRSGRGVSWQPHSSIGSAPHERRTLAEIHAFAVSMAVIGQSRRRRWGGVGARVGVESANRVGQGGHCADEPPLSLVSASSPRWCSPGSHPHQSECGE